MADNRRDLLQRIKTNGEDASNFAAALLRLYYTGDPTAAGSPQKMIFDAMKANNDAITAEVAAYAAAAP